MGQATDDAKREALARLAELDRRDALLYAEKAEALAGVADLFNGRDDPAAPYMAMDIALELTIAPATASSRVRKARHLVYNLPRTAAALKAAELTIGQGIVLVTETEHLAPEMCREVEVLVIPEVLGLTPGDTRREIARVIVKLDHLAAEKRRQEQAKQRRVWNSPRPDGRALIGGELSAEDAGIFTRELDDLANATFTDADDRTDDQKRADLFRYLPGFALAHADGNRPTWSDYLGARGEQNLHGCTVPIRRRSRAQAVVLIPVETSLDLADDAAELLGYGPISGAHARELLADADLRKACSDAQTGRMIHLDAVHNAGPARTERERPVIDAILDLVLTPSVHDDTLKISTARVTGSRSSSDSGTCAAPDPVAPAPPTARTSTTSTPGPKARPKQRTSALPAAGVTTRRLTVAGRLNGTPTEAPPGPAPSDRSGTDLPADTPRTCWLSDDPGSSGPNTSSKPKAGLTPPNTGWPRAAPMVDNGTQPAPFEKSRTC